MTRRDRLVSIASGIVLGLLLAVFILSGGSFTVNARAAQDADVDSILTLILTSHTKWETVQGEATVTWFGPDGTVQEYVQSFMVSQPASARFEFTKSPVDLSSDLWVSDGAQLFEASSASKTYTQRSIPAFAFNTDVLPKSTEGMDREGVYHHPFSLLIPSPLAEYLYPQWFAQGQADGVYKLLGEETLLGRKVWSMDYQIRNNHVLAWIDQETGLILRYIQEIDGQKFVEVNFTSISFDEPIDGGNFSVPPDYDRVETPEDN